MIEHITVNTINFIVVQGHYSVEILTNAGEYYGEWSDVDEFRKAMKSGEAPPSGYVRLRVERV